MSFNFSTHSFSNRSKSLSFYFSKQSSALFVQSCYLLHLSCLAKIHLSDYFVSNVEVMCLGKDDLFYLSSSFNCSPKTKFHLAAFPSSGSCKNVCTGFRWCFCFICQPIIKVMRKTDFVVVFSSYDRHTRTSEILMTRRKHLMPHHNQNGGQGDPLSAERNFLVRKEKRRVKKVPQRVTVLQPYL